MRALFLALLLANVAFFAWANHFSTADSPPDPSPLARQIAAEKLRVLPPAGPAQSASPAAPVKAAAETPAAQTAAQTTALAAPLACLEWGGFSSTEAQRAAESLAPLALGTRLSRRQTEDSAGWWVFIAPQGGRQGALKKAAELKTLGVEEYFILPDDGPLRFALSLGVFKTEAAAASRLEALRARGVKTAQIGPREAQVQKTYFQVRQVDAALAARLQDIAQSFTTTELRQCAAAPG